MTDSTLKDSKYCNLFLNKSDVQQYAIAFVQAIIIVLIIDLFTNVMPPRWDTLNYIDMAKNGIVNNKNLIAPFVYSPGMPFLSRWIADLFSVPVEHGFQIVGWVCAVFLLCFVFVLAQSVSMDFKSSIIIELIVGLIGIHIKLSLFFYSMVDISGFVLIVTAFWALLKKKYVLCLVISTIGVLFKEFLAIPLFLLLFCLAKEYLKFKSKKKLALLAVAAMLTVLVIAIPRLAIHVHQTQQDIDPFNDPGSLRKLFTMPFKGVRDVNIIFVLFSYWLPTLLLLNKKRVEHVWAELKEIRFILIIYMALNLLLVMYGGTNLMIFVSYMLPLQVVLLATMFKGDVHPLEITYVFIVLVIFFKIFQTLPLPEIDFNGYIDFYGGWGSRVNIATIGRFIQMALFILLANLLRWGIRGSGKRRDSQAAI